MNLTEGIHKAIIETPPMRLIRQWTFGFRKPYRFEGGAFFLCYSKAAAEHRMDREIADLMAFGYRPEELGLVYYGSNEPHMIVMGKP